VEHLDRERFEVGLAWGPGDLLDRQAGQIAALRCFEVADLIRSVAPAQDLRGLLQLREVIRSFRPDLVHTHSSKAGILGRLAARLERVKVVVHSVHGFGFTPLQPVLVRGLFYAAEKLFARQTDHFVAVSRRNLEHGVELGLFQPEQVSLIRSGIELARFRNGSGGEEFRQRLGIPFGAPLVTQVGNFKPQKAPLDFVRMAAAVAHELPECCFVMVGDGPLRNQAQNLARELGLGRRLAFCGWLDDIPALLTTTQVSVLSSRHEGLPRAVVESLAAGVPVVATAVDGTQEVVRHGENGFLAAPGDVSALAQGVCALLRNHDLRQGMASAAPQGLEEFDIDLMVRQQEDLYLCLLGRSPS
jgi:glycosyltransferase involved in cell wall biosynthesis